MEKPLSKLVEAEDKQKPEEEKRFWRNLRKALWRNIREWFKRELEAEFRERLGLSDADTAPYKVDKS